MTSPGTPELEIVLEEPHPPLVDPAEIERAIRDELRLGEQLQRFAGELARSVRDGEPHEWSTALSAAVLESSRALSAARRWRAGAEAANRVAQGGQA